MNSEEAMMYTYLQTFYNQRGYKGKLRWDICGTFEKKERGFIFDKVVNKFEVMPCYTLGIPSIVAYTHDNTDVEHVLYGIVKLEEILKKPIRITWMVR